MIDNGSISLGESSEIAVDDEAVTISGGGDQVVNFGSEDDDVFIPSLKGKGDKIVQIGSDGQLERSDVSAQQVIDNTDDIRRNTSDISDNSSRISTNRKKIGKLEDAASALGNAAEAAGAMGAALSGVPELTLLPDEPVRCGVAGGGFGSQYAIAGGCAARISGRVHLNGAIAYSPSVDYKFGSTSNIAGRVGISFPIGVSNAKPASAPEPSGENWSGEQSSSSAAPPVTPPSQPLWYRTEVKQEISQLQSDVASRDEEIEALKAKLESLIENDGQSKSDSSLIAVLQDRISQLEKEKAESDQVLKDEIEALKNQLADQERRFESILNRLQASGS